MFTVQILLEELLFTNKLLNIIAENMLNEVNHAAIDFQFVAICPEKALFSN